MGSSETRGSTDTHKHRDRALPNYFGEDAPERAGESQRCNERWDHSRMREGKEVELELEPEADILGAAWLGAEVRWRAFSQLLSG